LLICTPVRFFSKKDPSVVVITSEKISMAIEQ
jgi:hypothetical protein